MNEYGEYLERIAVSMELIVSLLAQQARQSTGDTPAPNHQRTLAEYPAFEWERIDAEVLESDEHGATLVMWHGREYMRRRHADYDAGLWFSRYVSKDEEGKRLYERLITFADRVRTVKGLPDEVTDRLASMPRRPSAAAAPPPDSELDDFFPRPADPAPKPDPTPTPEPEPAATPNDKARFYARLTELIQQKRVAPGVARKQPLFDEIDAAKKSGDWAVAIACLEAQQGG